MFTVQAILTMELSVEHDNRMPLGKGLGDGFKSGVRSLGKTNKEMRRLRQRDDPHANFTLGPFETSLQKLLRATYWRCSFLGQSASISFFLVSINTQSAVTLRQIFSPHPATDLTELPRHLSRTFILCKREQQVSKVLVTELETCITKLGVSSAVTMVKIEIVVETTTVTTS